MVLSYPAGVLVTLLSFIPIYMGIATMAEGVVLSMPLYMALGYVQWYRLVPKYVSGRSR